MSLRSTHQLIALLKTHEISKVLLLNALGVGTHLPTIGFILAEDFSDRVKEKE